MPEDYLFPPPPRPDPHQGLLGSTSSPQGGPPQVPLIPQPTTMEEEVVTPGGFLSEDYTDKPIAPPIQGDFSGLTPAPPQIDITNLPFMGDQEAVGGTPDEGTPDEGMQQESFGEGMTSTEQPRTRVDMAIERFGLMKPTVIEV